MVEKIYGKEWHDINDDRLNNKLISDAKDVEQRRLKVIEYSKTMKNSIAEVLASFDSREEKGYYNETKHKQLMDNTYMKADTAKLNIEIEKGEKIRKGGENSEYKVLGIDFGLERRPKTKIVLNKQIEGVKVYLANKDVIVDTKQGVSQNVNWVKNNNILKNQIPKYTKGKLQIYMDEEIMQGATLEIEYKITVENQSEVDYTGQEGMSVGTTYYTGKQSSSDKIVTTSVDKIIDYVDNNIVFRKEDNAHWNLVENISELKNAVNMKHNGYLNNNLKIEKEKLEGGETEQINQLIETEVLKTSKLKPGEKLDVKLVLSRNISGDNEQEELVYDNIAEILQLSNSVGRRDEEAIPGNQPPAESPKEYDADYTERVIILPPFGFNKSMMLVIFSIIVGVLIIIGIKVKNGTLKILIYKY